MKTRLSVCAACLLVCGIFGGCESKEPVKPLVALKEAGSASKSAQAPSPQAVATELPSAGGGKASLNAVQDNWNRIRECAAQPTGSPHEHAWIPTRRSSDVKNHYSPTYGRCYMEITYLNSEARKNPELLPEIYHELWDAFEEKLLSICTDGPVQAGELSAKSRIMRKDS